MFWQLRSLVGLGQGETQGGWAYILLPVQYSAFLFACNPYLLVGVNVPDACKSNQSKRPTWGRCSIWYVCKVHQRFCTHMHIHKHIHLNIVLLLFKNVIKMHSERHIMGVSFLMIKIIDLMDHYGWCPKSLQD